MKPPVDRLMLGQARAEVTELRKLLADATKLLGEWLTIGDRDPYAGLRTRTNAFLANAPAKKETK
jgi:hypothetical protein